MKEKNNIHRAIFSAVIFLSVAVAGILLPFSQAKAQEVGIRDSFPAIVNETMTVAPNGQQFGRQICPIRNYDATNPAAVMRNRAEFGLVKRMVYCVKMLVIPAGYTMLQNISIYLASAVAAACTLAVAFWGVLMAVGKNSAPMRDAFVVAIKIGAVSLFTFTLGSSTIWPDGLFPIIIAITDEFINIVTSYIGYSSTMPCARGFAVYDVWGRIDCALNALFGGIFNPAHLATGLVGFFVSAFISGTFGLFIALAGFFIIFFLMFAIIRATYITITAYIALALMAIISPVFITLLLFNSTRGYFEKWLKLTIGFMLQPMFLFAYLAMMLAAFDTVLYDGQYSVYRAIVPKNVIGSYPDSLTPYPNNPATNPTRDFFIGTWLIDQDIYREAEAASVGVSTNPRLEEHVKKHNVGILGTTGSLSLPDKDFEQQNASGMAVNVLDAFEQINVYKVFVPVDQISWLDLALAHLCPATDRFCTAGQMEDEIIARSCPSADAACLESKNEEIRAALDRARIDFLIQLFLSMLIAVITMYFFYIMLDLMPFIGSGIVGEKYSMPTLGGGNLGVPGNSIISKMKDGLGSLAGGGK